MSFRNIFSEKLLRYRESFQHNYCKIVTIVLLLCNIFIIFFGGIYLTIIFEQIAQFVL